jgi:hypothetical protein
MDAHWENLWATIDLALECREKCLCLGGFGSNGHNQSESVTLVIDIKLNSDT